MLSQPTTWPARAGTSPRLFRSESLRRPTVLCLFTGGYCRAPLAAGFLKAYSSKLEVTCAGTTDIHAGKEPATETLVAVFERTGGPFTYTPHQVTPDEIEQADVIVCLAAEHRAWLAEHYPETIERSLLFSALAGEEWDVPDPGEQSLNLIRPIAYLMNQVVRRGVVMVEAHATIHCIRRGR